VNEHEAATRLGAAALVVLLVLAALYVLGLVTAVVLAMR
jgi:hypothetical protein